MLSGSLNILALDPGGSTGWAMYSGALMAFEGNYEVNGGAITQGQLGPEEHHLALWNLLGLHHARNFIIVCESFEYRQDQRPNVVLVSKEYIGVVKLFVEERNRTLPHDLQITHVPQTAATGKGFWYPKVPGKKASWDGSKLKAVGLYQPTTQGRHINDATAHLLQFLTFGNHFGNAQKLQWQGRYLQLLKDL
jgi:hypothetical protein